MDRKNKQLRRWPGKSFMKRSENVNGRKEEESVELFRMRGSCPVNWKRTKLRPRDQNASERFGQRTVYCCHENSVVRFSSPLISIEGPQDRKSVAGSCR